MTHLCYTLDEAAEKLNLSETVLVRLSQSFKVPSHAYEEVGYLSFKGDLTFSDQDIAFFRQVKERLLAGETLEEVKSRIRHNEPADPVVHAQPTQAVVTPAPSREPQYAQYTEASAPVHHEPPAAEAPIGLSRLREPAEPLHRTPPPTVEIKPPAYQPAAPEPGYSQPAYTRPEAAPEHVQTTGPAYEPSVGSTPMVEIEDRTPFEKAAERSFNRYKNTHHPGLGKVFEKMIKEVGTHTPEAAKRDKFPVSKPMKSHVQETDELYLEDLHPEAQLPFKNRARQADDKTPPWEHVLKQASRQPRALNTNLKTAAMLLRERALSSEPGTPRSSRR